MLRGEFELAMALAGVRGVDDIRALGTDLVRRRG
jgi:hypothetical protein